MYERRADSGRGSHPFFHSAVTPISYLTSSPPPSFSSRKVCASCSEKHSKSWTPRRAQLSTVDSTADPHSDQTMSVRYRRAVSSSSTPSPTTVASSAVALRSVGRREKRRGQQNNEEVKVGDRVQVWGQHFGVVKFVGVPSYISRMYLSLFFTTVCHV